MKPEQVMPTIQIVLSLFTAIGYACHGDWRHAIYWLAAGTLTTTVTY